MSMYMLDSVKDFKERLSKLSRKELLEVIKEQNPAYIKQINRIEYVFKNKLNHLYWDTGEVINGRQLTNEELITLIDPPFIFDRELAKLGFNEDQQRQILIASDPVLWSKTLLEVKPRVYQTLMLRDQNSRKVMRFGRRLGKTFSLAILILWHAYVNPKGRILVVAPMKSQVGLIYEEVMNMAEKNNVVFESITRHVTSPQFEIQFSNGSTVRFFTSGMKSNGKTDVARGQEADVIILDEMDYMGPEDLVALLAMLQNTNEEKRVNKMLVGASTPSGQRNTFWKWNTDPAFGFSSFWYPSYVNPGWDKETEARMRMDYPNEQTYRHEVEADWGEDVEGVYPRRFIDVSFQEDWKYQPSLESARSFFVFGVDWDKYGAGVNIVILEICNDNHENELFAGRIRLAFREEINKGDFTYTAAIDRIIELNNIFKPKHIYIDRGAGEVQLELLHKYGMENPHTKLHKTTKGWQFAETIEIRDPFTKQLVKKDLKPFMVDNLYQMLENQMILFPNRDEELYYQLISYIVIRTSSTGRPVFAPGGQAKDHAHDALILACFAIADNYDELLNPTFASKSISVSNDVFSPILEINSEEEAEIASDIWGDGSAPVKIRRTMSYDLRGSRVKSVQRKMF